MPQEKPKSTKKFIMPIKGTITSKFGMRIHPVDKKPIMHNGWDIAAPIGTPIQAMAEGKVIHTGSAGGYGKVVVIEHKGANGEILTTEYGHISSSKVIVGQTVKQGETIAHSGNEGKSSGPHLHITIRKGKYRGEAVDPSNYIQF